MKKTHRFFCNTASLVGVFIFVFVLILPCSAKNALYVPEQLQPWVEWVMHDKKEQLECIPYYNDTGRYQCAWPSQLSVTLTDQGGAFKQSWLIHHETWVPLPGNSTQWPQEVQVNGEPRIILQKNNIPGVFLQTGMHTTTGAFTWPELPENLQIPQESALVSLTVNNKKVAFPNLDTSGRLWLKSVQTEEKIEDRLKIESFRLITDSIPCQILLYFTLDVSGSAREITLGPLYALENFTPLSIKSPLPAKLEQDGKLKMQVRPGQYHISLNLRYSGPIQSLVFDPPDDGFWPRQEIWSFNAQPDLRLVEINGVPSIDPVLTSLPKGWHAYPAYRILPGESMQFTQIKRGDPQPAPDQLTLDRSLWLKFDGTGYTIQDTIKGQKNTNWRLEIDPSIALGRVNVDGVEQLITRQKGSDKAGIELRNGRINLVADSVYPGKISNLPATGWDHDFQEVKGRLYLPPGWKLLNATGIDNIPRTWIKKWTLLDFFIVLIFTIALAKLFSKPLAGIAFLTLVLIYHEPGAPVYVWLALLIGFALLKYLPEGKFKKLVKIYQGMAVLSLVAIVIPYTVQALRIGMYPQLERSWTSMIEYASQKPPASRMVTQMDSIQEMAPQKMLFKAKPRAKKAVEMKSNQASNYGSQVIQYDPKSLTQTGPGLPRWLPFETIHFNWTGPVTRDQAVSFTLIGPRINLVLSFVRVFLILLLSLGMFGIRYKKGIDINFNGIKTLKIFSFLVLFLLSTGLAKASEIPSQQLLDALQERLLEKDECFPSCSDISQVHIKILEDELIINAHIDSKLSAAIPIPGHIKHWLPQEVLIDGIPARGMLRNDNWLWMMIPPGKHIVTLSGPIRKQNILQLPFPLKPHAAIITAKGWSVEGVHPDGKFDDQLQFKRIVEQDNEHQEVLETGVLPSFVQVERTLLLGLVWKVKTTLTRLSPAGAGIILDIPLIPGESVTTEGVRVTNGLAKINLRADQRLITWESFLEPSDQVLLTHQQTSTWTEIWRVDVSPIFHLTYEGIPVILHKTGTRWYPTWHPWPGETVSLNIFRPAGIKGQTLTIEKSHLELRPGRKTTAARMMLSIKSSQGGQHTLSLPSSATLQEVSIMGKLQPVRQDGRNVALPITPGQQDIELKWIESEGMTTRYKSSSVDLGAPSVNTSIDIYLPKDRWPLFVGGDPLVGPAVLFWSVIIIIVLVAAGLSRTGWAQLKFYHWLLLGIGLSMSHLAAGFIVVGWLIALDRRKTCDHFSGHKFNFIQIGIIVLTLAAMGSMVYAISNGLLGHPDMNIVGNGSNRGLLRWYQDVSHSLLPQTWVFSIPMMFYRISMLAWALWLSFWLVGILKWGWQQFTRPTIWYALPLRIKKGGKTDSSQEEKE